MYRYRLPTNKFHINGPTLSSKYKFYLIGLFAIIFCFLFGFLLPPPFILKISWNSISVFPFNRYTSRRFDSFLFQPPPPRSFLQRHFSRQCDPNFLLPYRRVGEGNFLIIFTLRATKELKRSCCKTKIRRIAFVLKFSRIYLRRQKMCDFKQQSNPPPPPYHPFFEK